MLGVTQPCTSLDSKSLQAHVTPTCGSESRFVPHLYSQSCPSLLPPFLLGGLGEEQGQRAGVTLELSARRRAGSHKSSHCPSPGGSAGKAQFISDLSRDIVKPAFIFLNSICLRSHKSKSKPWARAQPSFVLLISPP